MAATDTTCDFNQPLHGADQGSDSGRSAANAQASEKSSREANAALAASRLRPAGEHSYGALSQDGSITFINAFKSEGDCTSTLLEKTTTTPGANLTEIQRKLEKLSEGMGGAAAGLFRDNIATYLDSRRHSDSEKQKTLAPILSLLEKQTEFQTRAGLTLEDRQLAAEGFLHHLAYPETVSIGTLHTCNVAAMEDALIARSPSLLADMLVSTMQTGSWKAPDGKQINSYGKSLTAEDDDGNMQMFHTFQAKGGEEKHYPPASFGSRTFANQVITHVMMNYMGQSLKTPMMYREASDMKEEPRRAIWENLKTHELVKYDNPGFDKNGDLPPWMMATAMAGLTGETGTVLVDSTQKPQFADIPDKYTQADGRPYKDVAYIKTDKDLEEHLSRGHLPLVIGLNSLKLSIRFHPDETKREKDGDYSCEHYVSIQEYFPARGGKPARVTLKNNWGPGATEGTISVADLHRMMTTRDIKKWDS